MKPGDVIRAQLLFSNTPMVIKPDDYIPMRPIPISERLPKPYDPDSTRPQDCDPMGRCWTGSATLMVSGANDEDVPYPPFWELRSPLNADTHWLPWWALPLPEVES